jgi:Na+-translocating ferredoxin:NAD+ oxidoreductase subunit D
LPEDESNSPVTLYASVSPHVRDVLDLRRVMWTVNVALLPAVVAAIYFFRGAAVLHIAICVLVCVICEAAIQKWMKRPITIWDGSAVVTGVLLALNLPPEVPWWMGVFGGVFAIAVAKHCFGGLGYNIFNPALAARCFLLIAFAQDMSTGWAVPGGAEQFMNAGLTEVDALSGATALDALKQLAQGDTNLQIDYTTLKNLFIGRTGGCLGETSALLLLLGAALMFWRKVITWHIPISYCATVLIIGLIQGYVTGIGPSLAVFHLLAGGLILGAFFMATDMVTSPVTFRGRIIFGAGCGLLTMLIRIFGGYPEGVSFAILLMNCTTPLIDFYTRPKAFGTRTLKQMQAAAGTKNQ